MEIYGDFLRRRFVVCFLMEISPEQQDEHYQTYGTSCEKKTNQTLSASIQRKLNLEQQ